MAYDAVYCRGKLILRYRRLGGTIIESSVSIGMSGLSHNLHSPNFSHEGLASSSGSGVVRGLVRNRGGGRSENALGNFHGKGCHGQGDYGRKGGRHGGNAAGRAHFDKFFNETDFINLV